MRRKHLARWLLLGVIVSGVLIWQGAACTMIGSLDRFVPERPDDAQLRVTFHEPRDHNLGGPGLRLGGSPASIRFEAHEQRLSLRTGAYAWDQDLVGPILPVIPVLMGAGPCVPRLSIELHLEDDSEGILVTPGEWAVRVETSQEVFRPTSCRRGPLTYQHTTDPVPLDENGAVPLGPGESLSLDYSVDNLTTAAFVLEVPFAGARTSVRFRQETTRFLFLSW